MRTAPREPAPGLIAAVILILGALPLLINLGRAPANPDNMEIILFETCAETWRTAETPLPLLPVYQGEARVRKPPLAVWLNLASWVGLEREEATDQQLLLRARLVSVALGLVMLGAVWWLGRSLAGNGAGGLIAMAVCATCPLFQAEARLCSYDIHFSAWLTLAVAGAAAAVTAGARGASGRARGGRAAIIVAGAALGLAWLSKGPLALALYALAVGAIVASFARWRAAVLALVAPIGIAVIIALPWYAWLLASHPEAADLLAAEYAGNLSAEHPWWFYPSRGLAGAGPWALWLAAGLIVPLLRERARRDAGWMSAWLWLAMGFIVFTAVPGKASRYLLPLVPAGALVVAAALNQLRSAAPQGPARAWPGLALVHLVGLAVGGVALAALLSGWLIDPIPSSTYARHQTLGAGVAGAVGVLLLAAALAGLWLRARRSRERCIAVTFAWAIIASSALWLSTAAG